MRFVVGVGCLLAACGGGGSDAEQVVIHAVNARAVALDEGDGVWRPLSTDANGDVTIDATGPFIAARVCGDEPSPEFNYYVIYAGPGAGELDMRCQVEPVEIAVAAGTVPYTIVIGNQLAINAGESRMVFPGVYDVVAFSQIENGKVMIQHGVDLRASTTLTLDPERDGLPIRRAAIRSPSGAAFSLASSFLITEGGTQVRLSTTTETAPFHPLAALGPNDRLYAIVEQLPTLMSPPNRRGGIRVTSDDDTEYLVELPKPMTAGSVAWDLAPVATWSPSAEEFTGWTQAYFSASVPGQSLWDAHVLPSWSELDVTSIAIPDPRQIPEFFDPIWLAGNLQFPSFYDFRVEVTRDSDDELQLAAVEFFNGGAR